MTQHTVQAATVNHYGNSNVCRVQRQLHVQSGAAPTLSQWLKLRRRQANNHPRGIRRPNRPQHFHPELNAMACREWRRSNLEQACHHGEARDKHRRMHYQPYSCLARNTQRPPANQPPRTTPPLERLKTSFLRLPQQAQDAQKSEGKQENKPKHFFCAPARTRVSSFTPSHAHLSCGLPPRKLPRQGSCSGVSELIGFISAGMV
jgi:hypothetical protein